MDAKRDRLKYFFLIITVMLLGLSSRYFSYFLPGWLNQYLGDILWALMVFFMVGFIFRESPVLWVAAIALSFAFIVEISQLYHAPWIDNLRKTTIGGLILGFGFLWSDLLSYTIGVTIGVLLEKVLILR